LFLLEAKTGDRTGQSLSDSTKLLHDSPNVADDGREEGFFDCVTGRSERHGPKKIRAVTSLRMTAQQQRRNSPAASQRYKGSVEGGASAAND
jgi:hypothetical protein